MSLRRKWDELSNQVAGLTHERDVLLDQIAEDKAEWARLQQVRGDKGILMPWGLSQCLPNCIATH